MRGHHEGETKGGFTFPTGYDILSWILYIGGFSNLRSPFLQVLQILNEINGRENSTDTETGRIYAFSVTYSLQLGGIKVTLKGQ